MTYAKQKISINLMIAVMGILTMLLGALLTSSTHIYSISLFNFPFLIDERSFSIFTLFDGFFLLILGFLALQKTKASWRLLLFVMLITFALLAINSERRFHLTLIGVALNLFIIFLLFRRRKEYTMPSVTIGRPEIYVAIITVIFTISYGAGGALLFGNEFSPHITSLGNALYFTGETVTTLGFGDILPVTLTARMFTISLSILGVAIFFGAMTILITPIIQRRLGGVVTRMEKHQLDSLKNYTLVLGYSEFVHAYVSDLQKKGKTCVIVERSQQESEKLRGEGFMVINQNADDEDLIASFNLSNCERILVASNDDGYNILIAATINQAVHNSSTNENVVVLVSSYRNMNKFSVFGFQLVDVSSVISKFLSGK
ncbi:Calcium-gated potassium channel MthK [Thermoplasmatales archaeon]|nr:Calcium-gated potassium channel MthK [Thermoplasmatales archaeon]